MRYFLIIMIHFFLLSCNRNELYQPSEKYKIASEIRNRVAKKLVQKQGLIPFGTDGQMLDQIQMLGLYFQYRKPLNIDEGRELLVYAVQTFLVEVNTDQRVQPYLNNVPFQPRNIIISICPKNPDGSSFGGENLSIIDVNEGVLRYHINGPDGFLKEVYRETYEEALQKVRPCI